MIHVQSPPALITTNLKTSPFLRGISSVLALEFWIPYGDTEVPVRVPDDNFYKILEPPKVNTPKDPATLVAQSLDNPVGGAGLSQFSKQAGRAGVVVDPLIPVEFIRTTLETLKTRLSSLGVTELTVFLRKRSSKTVTLPDGLNGLTIQVDPSRGPFTEIGKTSSGTPVQVREDYLACGVKVCLNAVTPHFATGFTGGPESVLPGVSSTDTVTRNRSLFLRGDPSHQENDSAPILADTLEACRMIGPLYAISFIPDGQGGVDSIFSGELEPTFKEATTRYTQLHRPHIDLKPDIVILAAGETLGSDLYHGVRILSNAWNIVRKEGTMILAAECSGGIGDQTFQDLSRKFEDRKILSSELRHHFKLGAHVTLLLKEALERNRVQLVSVLPDHYVRMFNLKSARTASAAVQSSIRAEGKEAKVLIVTRGDLSLPVVQPS